VRLPVRAPFASADVMAFIGDRAIPGLESWDGDVYRRSLDLPAGPAVIDLTAHDDHVAARLALSSWSDLGVAVQRIRRLLDLDSDPTAVDAAQSARILPSPGSSEPFPAGGPRPASTRTKPRSAP
jgi:AraC family transcriptional regulator, regulatory protein of adaptative response / DNA-3-methyladenine glycosylase II